MHWRLPADDLSSSLPTSCYTVGVEMNPGEIFMDRNAAAVTEIMERYGNVHAVFQAHAHRLDVQVLHVGQRPCHFIVMPAIIEYPLGWLQLTLPPSLYKYPYRFYLCRISQFGRL